MERIQGYISHLQGVLERLSLADVRQSIDLVMETYQADRQIFVIGNGGSASTASHVATDLSKGTSVPGVRRFRVISLTDNVAIMTAWSTDVCYEDGFVEQLRGVVNPGDLVIGHAKAIGCKTIGWTGFGGGKLRWLADVSVVVDSYEYGPVEDVHLILNHILHAWIRKELTG